jgi:hypothetical protein
MKVSNVKDLTAQMVQKYQKNDSNVANSDKQQAASAAVQPEEKVDLSTKAKDIQQANNALSSVPVERKRETMINQFVATEVALQKLHSQSNWLASQLNAINSLSSNT